jgi:putative ABC transport system permease protein
MRGLHALAWRGLRARTLRSVLTMSGVALGVAVLFAGIATDAGIEASVDRTVEGLVGRADLRVAAFGEAGLSPATVEAISATPGVAVAAPAFERRTYLGLDRFGPGDALPAPVTVVGIDPSAELRLHDLTLASGAHLTRLDEPSALVGATLARSDDLVLGSELTIQGPAAPTTVRVVGILAEDDPYAGPTGRAVVMPLTTAQAAFDASGFTRVDVGIAPGTAPSVVVEALEGSLLEEPYVLSSPRELGLAMRASTGDFAATTALIAAVALFAGAFLIFNTLSMTVVERVRELGLLRAAGATRSQVASFILVQAVVIGAVGSTIGIVSGIALATGMAAWIGTVGDVALPGPVVTPEGVLAAFAMGMAVTLAAALEPARQAGRIPPVEALKSRMDLPAARRARLRWLVAVFLLVGVFGLLIWPRAAGDAGLIRALAVYAALLVVALCVPFLLPFLTRVAGLPFIPVARLEERLARASVLRDRGRAAMTVSALTVGLAMIVALGGVGQHARAAAGAWIADVVPGDVLLTSIFPRTVDEGLDDILSELPGVASISPIASFDLAIDGVRVDGAAMVGSDLASDGRFHLVSGERSAALAAIDAGGSVIVPATVAERDGLAVGDELDGTTTNGSVVVLRIVGIAERTLPGDGGEAFVVGWPDAAQLGVAGADAYAVRFAPDADAAARETLADEARSLALDPVPLGRIQGVIGAALDRVFGLFDALALVAVVVAALGIVNTLTMNVFERVREIGVLRAAGMTRRQVWRSVVVEAGVTGGIGAICGIAAGLLIGALMVVLAGGRPDVAIGVPWLSVAVALVFGIGLAMLAAAYPARLAARVSIVRAVGYE